MAVEWTDDGVPYLSDQSLIGDVPEYTQLLRLGGATPVGSVQPFAGDTAPEGWFICDGEFKSEADYPELFRVLGIKYRKKDPNPPYDWEVTPTGQFRVPDLRGRSVNGHNSGDASFNTVGFAGGRKDQMVPYHNHGGSTAVGDHIHSILYNDENGWYAVSQFGPGGNIITHMPATHTNVGMGGYYRAWYGGGFNVGTTVDYGGDSAGTATGNLSPYVVMQWIIKHDYPKN